MVSQFKLTVVPKGYSDGVLKSNIFSNQKQSARIHIFSVKFKLPNIFVNTYSQNFFIRNIFITPEYSKTMGEADRMDQNISQYMMSIRNKKQWWPLFRFCIDLAVNDAYQLYRIQHLQPGQQVLDLLGFNREVVNVYYARNRFLRGTAKAFPAPRKQEEVSSSIRYDQTNHWIAKGKQRRCGNCSKSSIYYCEKFNIGLHPECFKDYHTKKP